MAKDLNNVNLIGRMVREEEIRATSTGKKVLTFTLAVNNANNTANFIECVAWENTAEFISKYANKGARIAVTGVLNQESWEKDGQKRSKLNVVVRDVQLLENKPIAKPQPVEEEMSEPVDLSQIPF